MQNSQSSIVMRAGITTAVSLVLGLLFDYFFWGKIPGLAFPLYVLLMVVALHVIASFHRSRLSREILWLLLPLIFFSAMVFFRSSVLLTFLNLVASLLLLLVIAKISSGRRLRSFEIGDYVGVFFLPFRFVRPLLKTLSFLSSLRGVNGDRRALLQAVKGILMAIPVLLVFLLLLSSADLIFREYVSNVINIDVEAETVFRSVLVLIATLVCIGAYSYSLREEQDPIRAQQNSRNYSVGHIESSILLGSVNVLFFAFICVQVTYLFGGENNISARGLTYAEYARRGFFELIACAIISFFLLLTTEKYIKKGTTDHARGFKFLGIALVVQVLLIMASAFTRLSLYEAAYGFTTLRLYSHAFMIWLAAVFCLLLYKICRDRREKTFAFRLFISIAFFLAGMNLLNPDAFIARRNLERFDATGKLDSRYLSRLSDDAIPETVRVLGISNEDLRKSFARQLYWRAQERNSPHFSKWQSLNLSRIRAEKILTSRIHELEPYKDYEQGESDSIERYE